MKIIKISLLLSCFLVSLISFAQNPHAEKGLKKVTVKEVLQVEAYSYLYVLENDALKWLAVPKMEASVGEDYYYQGGMMMKNFKSTELDKVFEEIYFLGGITNADVIDVKKGAVDPNEIKEITTSAKKPTLNKLDLTIEKVEGGTRIGELFENKQNYEGKKIKIKGEVTKYSSGIMGKNWVHFQDGTAYQGAYDLMITTQEILAVGDVVVFEGIISLNKDFGAGYLYKIIMEEASVLK